MKPVQRIIAASAIGILVTGLGTATAFGAPNNVTAVGTASFTSTVTSSLPAVTEAAGPVVSESASDVTVLAPGDAAQNRDRENRSFSHSDLQPTGRFAKKGEPLTIVIPAGIPTLELAAGLYGPYQEWNNGASVAMEKRQLADGVNTVAAPVDGMVYLTNRSTTPVPGSVTVEGGQAVPMWVLGRTTPEDFAAQLNRYPTAPFVTLIGNRIFGEFQRGLVDASVNKADFSKVIKNWDHVVELTNKTYGLREDATGTAFKSSNRVYIANPDSGAGYAYATQGYIGFQENTKAGADLLAGREDQWGLWHEVGHTYQTPQYKSGLVEVTVNISSLAVQKELYGKNRLDDPGQQKDITAFFAKPLAERDFAAEPSLWAKLLMFDQLRRAFGDNFYPRLSQEYRVDAAIGANAALSQFDLFALKTAKVANRNLSPFFEQWGIPLSQEVKTQLAQYLALQQKIWENTLSTQDTRECAVGEYVVPTGKITSSVTTAIFGQETVDGIEVTNLGNTDGSAGARVVSTGILASNVGQGAGSVFAVLSNNAGVRELLPLALDVTAPRDFVEFQGLSDAPIARMGIDRENSQLRVFSTGSPAHYYFEGKRYFGLELRASDGTVIASSYVQGEDTGNAFAKSLDKQRIEDGQTLVLFGEEPGRVARFIDGQRQPTSNLKTQTFIIQNAVLTPAAS